MGLFDRFKKKAKATSPKDASGTTHARKAASGEAKGTVRDRQREQAVITPDGKLVSAPKKEPVPKKKEKQAKEDTAEAYRVLIRPLITEKGSSLSVYNQYVFEVAPHANKIEVRKAIHKVYGVDPIRITTMNIQGKSVRYGKSEGRTKRWRKAIITLKKGQKIDVQEGL